MTHSAPESATPAARSPAGASLRLLIVDDEEVDRMAVRRCLRIAGVDASVDEAASASEALERMALTPYDCVFLDYYVPGVEGLALLQGIHEATLGRTPVVIFTGRGDEEVAVELMKGGAADYLPKSSLSPDRIASSLRHALELARAESARREAHERLGESQERLAAALERERFLGDMSHVLATTLEHGEALEALTGLVIPTFADFAFFDLVEAGGTIRRVAWQCANPARLDRFEQARHLLPSEVSERHPAAKVLRTGEPEFVPEITEVWVAETAVGAEHEEFLRDLGVRSLIRVPVAIGEQAVGAFTLGMAESDRRYTEDDVDVAISIAKRAAVAIHNARLYSELGQAVKVRDEMTSVVSHDLRNPLNTIYTVAHLLLDTDPNPENRRQHLEIIRRCSMQMTRLLDDLVDISKAEAGHFLVEPRPEVVEGLLREAFDTFHPRASDPGVELRSEPDPALPQVLVDRQRILQVLSNLLANALKFTPRGGTITLGARQLGGEVEISVSDTGVGIPADILGRVFDRFWQARQASRASAGLGLAIAKTIVEAHGGRIWVESAEGSGTVFRFTVPAA